MMINPYLPEEAVITAVKPQTEDTNTYTLKLSDPEKQKGFTFLPGQFVMISILGWGEAAFSISSSPSRHGSFDCTIRNVGDVSGSLINYVNNGTVGVRGPYGRPWPVEEAKGKDVLIIAGGLGLAPIRPMIMEVMQNRGEYLRLEILYGAKTPLDMLFRDEFEKWAETDNYNFLATVDVVPDGVEWEGRTGLVTALLDEVETTPRRSVVLTCGPEIMMKFVVAGLLARGFRKDQVFLSLERRMKCGVGKCGHCQVGTRFVCKDGPVFTYADINGLADKIV